jgi:hypothetical protein
MAKGDNSVALVLLLVVCLIISGATGFAGWTIQNQPKEGDECEGYDEFGISTLNADKECVLSWCKPGYKLTKGVCVEEKIDLPPPPPPLISPELPAVKVVMGDSGRAYTIKEYTTNPDEDGGGNILYLDRHHIKCDNNAINSFELQRKSDDSGKLSRINYKVGCLDGIKSGTTDIKTTTAVNHEGGNNFILLESQHVDCDTFPISEFKLEKVDDDKMRYAYRCSTLNHSGDCREIQTEFSNDDGGNPYNLDRHNVKCDDGEAMTSFKLIRNPEEDWPMQGTRAAFEYKCCKMP